MEVFIIYTVSVFGLANLYYFQFAMKEKETWKKTMLRLMAGFSVLIFMAAVVLCIADVRGKIEDAGTFFIFLLIGNIMMSVYLLLLLLLNNVVNNMIVFVKSYGTYTFVFSLLTFFGLPLITFILYGAAGLLFGLE